MPQTELDRGVDLLGGADALLEHGLDDEVALAQVRERRRWPDPGTGRLRVVLAHASSLDDPRERAVDALPAAVDRRLVDLAHGHGEAGLRAYLRDPRSHRAEA